MQFDHARDVEFLKTFLVRNESQSNKSND